MAFTVSSAAVYYMTRRDQLQNGTIRLWKLELRPANYLAFRNRPSFDDDVPPVEIEFPDLFIDSIEGVESTLDRQLGLQTPPTIKITCAPEYAEQEFRDLVDGSGDYENVNYWYPTSDTGDYRALYNTWLISYSDDDGATWTWWFCGVQLPNEITSYSNSKRTKERVETIVLTVQHITHWILSQVEYWTWGKQLIQAASVDADFEWRMQNILYDTVFNEDFERKLSSGTTITETKTVNVSENWGMEGSGAANKDEAYLMLWDDTIEVLRAILNKGLRAHRIFSPNSDVYDAVPMRALSIEPTTGFFKQSYNKDGSLGASLANSDLYVVAAVKPEDSSEYLMGLFVNTLKSNGAGFDGETVVDGIANLVKGLGMKATYAVLTETDDPTFSLQSYAPRSYGNVRTLDAEEDLSDDWVFERGEYIARGAAFNIATEGDNDSEFRVYKSGNQDRDDIEAKMQMHNLPNIRTWTTWDNPDKTGKQQSYRTEGYTLRRWWYLDQPSGLSSGKPDHKVPIRVHEYCTYHDGVKEWDNTHDNPFVAVPRTDATLKADMLLMQRQTGMPNVIARALADIFNRPGIGKLKASVAINKVDYNDIGSRFDITIPATFTRLQNGVFRLEKVKPDFDKLRCECEFIFIPND